jgi:iron complex transport system ATP-binding protein
MLLRDGAAVARGTADDVITSAAVSHAFDFPLAIARTGGRWHARRSA